MSTETAESLRELVGSRYADAVRAVTEGSGRCSGGGPCRETENADFGETLYAPEQRGELPDAAALAS
jgi:hypothetical protein